jgi:hypothetical protein
MTFLDVLVFDYASPKTILTRAKNWGKRQCYKFLKTTANFCVESKNQGLVGMIRNDYDVLYFRMESADKQDLRSVRENTYGMFESVRSILYRCFRLRAKNNTRAA